MHNYKWWKTELSTITRYRLYDNGKETPIFVDRPKREIDRVAGMRYTVLGSGMSEKGFAKQLGHCEKLVDAKHMGQCFYQGYLLCMKGKQ